VQVVNGAFVPAFVQGTNQVFTCFGGLNSTTPVPVPKGTPGGT
jgi:hypothetical protein